MCEEEDWRHFHHTSLIVTYQVLFACYLDFEIPNFGLVRFAERTGREQVSCYLAVFLQWLFKKTILNRPGFLIQAYPRPMLNGHMPIFSFLHLLVLQNSPKGGIKYV